MFTIVGAGYAGRMALARLRIRCPDAPITLIEPRTHAEYRIQLHQVAAGHTIPHVDLATLTSTMGVTHIRSRVEKRQGRVLTLSDGATHASEALILAMGQRHRPAPGKAHSLADHAAALRLHEALSHDPKASVTIVGAGFTALETVTWLAHTFPDAHFTVWRAHPRWANLCQRAQGMVDAHLARAGVQVLEGGTVHEVHEDHARSSTTRHPHDLLVWLTGTASHSGGARRPADSFLSIEPGVFAAGDLTVSPGNHRPGCVTAMPMGVHAAENAARFVRGEALEPFRFRDMATILSLGPSNGVVQFSGRDGSPSDRAFQGRAAALTKAIILRYVNFVQHIEAHRRLPLFNWPRGRAQPLLPEPA